MGMLLDEGGSAAQRQSRPPVPAAGTDARFAWTGLHARVRVAFLSTLARPPSQTWIFAFLVWGWTSSALSAPPERWLAVEVVSQQSDSVRLRLTNLSDRPLHPLGAKSWGFANYIKVGFEAAPFPRVLRDGRWTDERPDLDFGLDAVAWAPLDALTAEPAKGPLPSRDLDPGTTVEVDVAFPPPSVRGNVELVVLARRGTQWLTYRQTVGTRLLLPGDARAGALRALLLAMIGLLAYRGQRRTPEGSGAATLARRVALVHSMVVLLVASVVLLFLHVLHYTELPYTDGVNYAVLARSHMEGHGLRSPVIFPGFMTLVPTSREGQVFVMQAPLWPLLLAYVFRLFGATALAVSVTGYALAAVTALAVWWIAFLASCRSGVAYLAVALLLTHPTYYAAISNGSTVPLQGALVSGLVLLMWAPVRLWSAIAAGILAGLGMVTRENTVFVVFGLTLCWWRALAAMARTETRRRLGVLLLAGLVCAAVPLTIEGARKSEALGGAGHPVVRATMLYGTPDFDSHWYWLYDYPLLGTSPAAYFREHPRALWNKMGDQIGSAFLSKTLPSLLTPSPWFVPVVLPWLLCTPQARRAGWSVLLALALQVVGASVSFLHPSYFVAFVPPLCALVAASIGGLSERRLRSRGVLRRLGLAAVLGYALTPLLLNISPMTEAGGVTMGDIQFDPRATERLFEFVREHTPPDSVIAFGHIPAPLLAWKTHRTVVSYDPAPYSRPGNTEMWRRLDHQLPLDFILLSSFTDANTSDVLEGFDLVATDQTRWLRAWLFGRADAQARGR
jgi:4-amino-4-deoxy-L-arabinose transferase-like glycosyltransferase